jgi:hypothetical protein
LTSFVQQLLYLLMVRMKLKLIKQCQEPLSLIDSFNCECSQGEETIQHVILVCRQWVKEREELRVVAEGRAGDVSFLLGGWGIKKDSKGQFIDGPREKWMPDLKVVKATIRFLEQTRRLNFRQEAAVAA